MFAKFLAQQLGNPSGWFGKLVLMPMWQRRNAALNDVALTALDLCPNDRVLEVGFGGGYLLRKMIPPISEGFIAGVDISSEAADFCEQRFRSQIQTGKLQLQCAKAESLPYPPESFNKICSVNSIFYWDKVPTVFSELQRVLREDGLLVICFTCKEYLKNRKFAQQGLRLYEAEEVQQMMESAGFSEIGITRHRDPHREFWCITGRKKRQYFIETARGDGISQRNYNEQNPRELEILNQRADTLNREAAEVLEYQKFFIDKS